MLKASKLILSLLLLLACIHAKEQPYLNKRHDSHTVLFVSLPSLFPAKDFEPIYFIARELQKLNADKETKYTIYFAGSDNFKPLIQEQDIQFVSYGVSVESLRNTTAVALQEIQALTDSGLSSYNLLKENLAWSKNVYVPYFETVYTRLRDFVEHSSIDLMVVHASLIAARDIAMNYQIPHIVVPTSLTALPNQPYYVPIEGSGLSIHSTLLQRVLSVWKTVGQAMQGNQHVEDFKKLRAKVMQQRDPKLEENDFDARTVQVPAMLYPTHQAFDYSFPVDPYIFYIGPIVPSDIMQLAQRYEQTKSIDAFINRDARDVIYINFGTTCIFHSADFYKQLMTLLQQMTDQSLKILISLPPHSTCAGLTEQRITPAIAGLKNVMPITVEYMSQAVDHYILANPKVKMMIGYGDFMSVHVAAYHKKPTVTFPLHQDHFDTSVRVRDAKLGTFVLVNEENWTTNAQVLIQQALSESKLAKLQKSSKIFQRINGIGKAVSLIEDILDYGNLDHLVPLSYVIPGYRLYSLDIVGLCFIVPMGALLVFSLYLMITKCKEYIEETRKESHELAQIRKNFRKEKTQ